jgi:hypothetical protein
MDSPRPPRLVETVLRCYPARWQRRHGPEAAEVAALLIQDGTPAGSVACSYLAGAAREWLTPRPGRHLTTVACALLAVACAVGAAMGLAPTAPASASSTSQARPPAHCRLKMPDFVAGMPPATGRPLVIFPGARHDRSC